MQYFRALLRRMIITHNLIKYRIICTHFWASYFQFYKVIGNTSRRNSDSEIWNTFSAQILHHSWKIKCISKKIHVSIIFFKTYFWIEFDSLQFDSHKVKLLGYSKISHYQLHVLEFFKIFNTEIQAINRQFFHDRWLNLCMSTQQSFRAKYVQADWYSRKISLYRKKMKWFSALKLSEIWFNIDAAERRKIISERKSIYRSSNPSSWLLTLDNGGRFENNSQSRAMMLHAAW